MTLLYTSEEWSEEIIENLWDAVEERGKFYGLNYYPPQIEIISATQMLDNYSSHGLPVIYDHWSFGKSFIANQQAYEKGYQGLAFEIVINTNPSICYIMESNTTTMQLLVLAHAAIGHSTFFKNNYLFKEWTDASTIIEFCLYAKRFIKKCEQLYGRQLVESTLDSAHSLQYFGVDKYKRVHTKTKKQQKEYNERLVDEKRKLVHELYKDELSHVTNPPDLDVYETELEVGAYYTNEADPDENLLEFLKQKSTILRPWQKEVINIIQYLAQYFYPQMQTQVTNEGFATFWHYTIMTDLYDMGKISESSYLQFLHSHSSVIYQPAAFHYSNYYKQSFPNRHYSGINPYALGFAIYRDIRRICENPTDEDKKLFPNLIGKNWLDEVKYAMENFNDSGFILQYLSPKVVRDLQLMVTSAAVPQAMYGSNVVEVTQVHDDNDFLMIRKQLSENYNLTNRLPQIIIKESREPAHRVTLQHLKTYDQELDVKSAMDTIHKFKFLWGKGEVSLH